MNSCLVPFVQVAGADVKTIEGVTADPANRVLAETFVRENGAQCGICTPGMVLATVGLLDEEAATEWDDDDLRSFHDGMVALGFRRVFTSEGIQVYRRG